MLVVVALTIWPPSRLRTTWTDDPVRLAPAAGCWTRMTAADDGLAPLAPGDVPAGLGLGPGPEAVLQAATRPASNAASKTAAGHTVAMRGSAFIDPLTVRPGPPGGHAVARRRGPGRRRRRRWCRHRSSPLPRSGRAQAGGD